MYSCMQRYDTRMDTKVKIVLYVVVFMQNGKTALMWAAQRDQAMVEVLLTAGANVDIQSKVSTPNSPS